MPATVGELLPLVTQRLVTAQVLLTRGVNGSVAPIWYLRWVVDSEELLTRRPEEQGNHGEAVVMPCKVLPSCSSVWK